MFLSLSISKRKIVSLEEMIKFHAAQFYGIARLLEWIRCNAGGTRTSLGDEKSELRQQLLGNADLLCGMLGGTGLKMSLLSAERLRALIAKAGLIDASFSGIVEDLNGRLTDELQSIFFFTMTQAEAELYNPPVPILGMEVMNKFPDFAEDIVEAGNCFALSRYTACVFHLMRVMENAVQRLGVLLTGTPSIVDKEWQKIINDVRGEINTRYPKHNDLYRVKYEAILGQMETVKIAWRNPTMHPKQTYTEEEAEGVMNSVKVFMRELAKVI